MPQNPSLIITRPLYYFNHNFCRLLFPDAREDLEHLESRSSNLGPYWYFIGTPFKGSTFWNPPWLWAVLAWQPQGTLSPKP